MSSGESRHGPYRQMNILLKTKHRLDRYLRERCVLPPSSLTPHLIQLSRSTDALLVSHSFVPRLAPVSREVIRNYFGTAILGLP